MLKAILTAQSILLIAMGIGGIVDSRHWWKTGVMILIGGSVEMYLAWQYL